MTKSLEIFFFEKMYKELNVNNLMTVILIITIMGLKKIS